MVSTTEPSRKHSTSLSANSGLEDSLIDLLGGLKMKYGSFDGVYPALDAGLRMTNKKGAHRRTPFQCMEKSRVYNVI
ncbi:MAG: hypothetical protein ACHQIH_01890, partial [Ignavibacteria bacterium]